MKLIEAKAAPEVKKALARGDTTINKVATEIKHTEKKVRRESA